MTDIIENIAKPLVKYAKHAFLAEVNHVRSGVDSIFRGEGNINEKALDRMADHIIEAALNRALLKIEFMRKSEDISIDYRVGPLTVFRPGRELSASEQEQMKIEKLVSNRPAYSHVLRKLGKKGLNVQDIKHDIGSVHADAPMNTVFTLIPKT